MTNLSGEHRSHSKLDYQRHLVHVDLNVVQQFDLVEAAGVIQLVHFRFRLQTSDVLADELIQLAQLISDGNLDVVEAQVSNLGAGLSSQTCVVVLLHRLTGSSNSRNGGTLGRSRT